MIVPDRTAGGLGLITVLLLLAARPGPAAEASYDYLLVLPLQHNYYQPAGPVWLGLGGSSGTGAGALFANPAGIAGPGSWQAELSGGWMSGGRSGLSLSTAGSGVWPSLAAARFVRGKFHLALGWHRMMDVSLAFPDVIDPRLTDRAELSLDGISAGLAYSGIERLTLGLAVSRTGFSFDWQGPSGSLTSGGGNAWSLSAGLEADLDQGFFFLAGFATKSDLSCLTSWSGDSSGGILKLAGTVPPKARASVIYRPEPGFMVTVGLEASGWHLSSSGYYEQTGYHLGCRMELVPQRLELLLGSYSLKHPLDPFLRRYDQQLQDLYFLCVGLSLRAGPGELVLSGAASRLLSGPGMNQNLLAAGMVLGR